MMFAAQLILFLGVSVRLLCFDMHILADTMMTPSCHRALLHLCYMLNQQTIPAITDAVGHGEGNPTDADEVRDVVAQTWDIVESPFFTTAVHSALEAGFQAFSDESKVRKRKEYQSG